MMGQEAHHYLIFETAGGFCGIAWNDAGITRFQLPTKSATTTERMLLRQVTGAKPREPTPEVAEAVAAVRRYFEGEETDFSRFKLDLGEQDPFFERIYAVARRVGWGRATTYGALAKELGTGPQAARDVGQGHCQLNGLRAPFPPRFAGERAADWASKGLPLPEPPRHRHEEHTMPA
jgi:methylated-DNA-[protein]-cysteine S-methyltransferase